MSASNIENICSVFNLATAAELATGLNWYAQAKKAAAIMAQRYGIHTHEAAGVIAALSPRNRWERNLSDAEHLIAAFVAAGAEGCATVKVCTFSANKAKAIKILSAGCITDADVIKILSGPKLTEFYSCIVGIQDVCIDGHAYAIWFGERVILSDVPSIGVKLRREIKADYVYAAEVKGISPAEMQAVTWCVWRRLHGVTN
jgi:hypothetical protein